MPKCSLKAVNDAHGHAVGDEVLEQAALRCRQQLRKVDILGRFGGEEFAVLLPESSLEGARKMAERLRQTFEDPLRVGEAQFTVTLSLGVAALNETTPDLAALLQAADRALYQAKAAGRNRTWVAPAS